MRNDLDSYDLLITDNDMPKVTGLELVRKLRAARMALPVIMASGTLPVHDPERSLWFQPAAVLLKPYRAEELLTTVIEVLGEPGSPSEPIARWPDSPRHPSVVGWQL
jgi:CheY-like chemotaxis protein